MPAARTKSELLAVTTIEWDKLTSLLAAIDSAMSKKLCADSASIKDVLAHRAHWIGLFFQWVSEGADGGPVAMPDHGVKWSELKRYNAKLHARYSEMTWPEVRAWLTEEHGRLVHFLSEVDDEMLYSGPMPGGTGWTMGRYAEAAGPSHYRSAAKFIRACMKAAKQTESA